jgi:hypothetical protein
MEKIPRLTESQRENLVAYLDGELSDDESQQINTVLAKSPTARHDVEMLSRTVELLELLPRPQASEDFTRKTLASLKAIGPSRAPVDFARFAKYARRTVVLGMWMGALVLSVYAGYSLTNRWIPSESDLLLDDLQVIEQFDKYREVPDMTFLRELHKRGGLSDALVP